MKVGWKKKYDEELNHMYLKMFQFRLFDGVHIEVAQLLAFDTLGSGTQRAVHAM